MDAFAMAFSNTAALDGVIFKFDTGGWDIRQQTIANLRNSLMELRPMSQRDFERLFKVHIFNMTTDKTRAIVKIEVFGELAKACINLPAGYLGNLHGLHLKSYVFSVADPEGDILRARIFESEGGQQTTLFGAQQVDHASKGSGKGFRVGDRKSDYHFVAYTRRGQRMGLEMRVQDRPIRRTAAEVLEFAAQASITDRGAWLVTCQRVASLAAERFTRDMAVKNIPITSHVSGLTDNPHAHDTRVEYYSTTQGTPWFFDSSTGEYGPVNEDRERP